MIQGDSHLVPSRVLQPILVWRERLIGPTAQSLALLLGRFAVGLLFLSTGWGKVHSIPKVTQFFIELGIPLPGFNAVLVGWSELLCGAALIVGLLTRLATFPLIMSMIVALLTAKLKDIHGIFDLVGADEFTYLALLVVIAAVGPGALSIDRALFGKMPATRVD